MKQLFVKFFWAASLFHLFLTTSAILLDHLMCSTGSQFAALYLCQSPSAGTSVPMSLTSTIQTLTIRVPVNSLSLQPITVGGPHWPAAHHPPGLTWSPGLGWLPSSGSHTCTPDSLTRLFSSDTAGMERGPTADGKVSTIVSNLSVMNACAPVTPTMEV